MIEKASDKVAGKAAMPRAARRARRTESGYVMVAVLAAMTISLIFIAGALPAWKHDLQREREEEMFYRAEQISKAIERYGREHNNQFPISLDLLTQENVTPGQTKRYLRESALKDPMTLKGEWIVVRMGNPVLRDVILAFATTMKLNPVQAQQLLQRYGVAGPVLDLNNGDNSSQGDSGKKDDERLGAENLPIVGVSSRSKETPIRNYFGLDAYKKIVVLAGLPSPRDVIVPGLLGGVGGIGAGGGQQQQLTGDPKADDCIRRGGKYIDGHCTAVLIDGICPPTDERCRPQKEK